MKTQVTALGPRGTLSQPHVLVDEHGNGVALRGAQCTQCQRHYFPNPQVCAHCRCEDLESKALSTSGNLYTHTVVHVGELRGHSPYAVGYVDLPEDLRMFARIASRENLHPGMPVSLSLNKLTDESGQTLFEYCFEAQTEEARHA